MQMMAPVVSLDTESCWLHILFICHKGILPHASDTCINARLNVSRRKKHEVTGVTLLAVTIVAPVLVALAVNYAS